MLEENETLECHLLLDSARGIYIPKNFAEIVDPDLIVNYEKFKKDLEICLDPNNEFYWDAWSNILDNMQVKLKNNEKIYSLYQDGDLFAVIYNPDFND